MSAAETAKTDAPVALADAAVGEPAPVKKARHQVTIYYSWCKSCGICVAFCPKKVFDSDLLDRPQPVRQQDCTGCQQCVLHCPDFAIRVDRLANKEA